MIPKKLARFAMVLATLAAMAVPLAAGAGTVLATGKFTGASNHATTGGVTVLRTDSGLLVILEPDFSFDGAPDPKVGFGNDGTYDPKSQLGHLAGNAGLQVYAVPASVDPGRYNEVYIWCERYGVPLGVAALE